MQAEKLKELQADLEAQKLKHEAEIRALAEATRALAEAERALMSSNALVVKQDEVNNALLSKLRSSWNSARTGLQYVSMHASTLSGATIGDLSAAVAGRMLM